MGFSTTDVNKLTFKVQAGGVIDADSGARWYESKLSFSPKVIPARILTNYNLIPVAANIATAQSNAAADPTNIRETTTASPLQLSRVTAGADNTWIAYTTLDTPSGGVEQNWIQPPSIPQANGNASIGYSIKLWSGNPNGAVGTFQEILTTAEQDPTPDYVAWVWNYDMGGTSPAAANRGNVIDYITIQTLGNSSDFGDLTQKRSHLDAGSNAVRGIFVQGIDVTPSTTPVNTLDYVTMATLGNAVEFGDATTATLTYGRAVSTSPTRLVAACGGYGSSPYNINAMDYVEIMTTGNTIDFGDALPAAGLEGPVGFSNGHGGLG